MSEYFSNLPNTEKSRYEHKLHQIGLTKLDDPLLKGEGWVDDVTRWPELQFGQIYVYLIDSPGLYTRENLKAYKSLEAYNQFYSGWVHTCYVKDTGEHSIIKTNVNRSQALSDKPHEVWVALLRTNGTVVTGHCTCMAGLGQVCSHVAALLFKVEACTRLGFNKVSCTSIPCQLNQNFTKKVSAATLKEISFQKPRCDNFHNKMPTTVQNVEPTKFADTSSFLQKLRKTNPNAVIFTITNPKPQPKLCGPSLPPVLSKLYSEENLAFSQEELVTQCKEVLAILHITSAQADKLEKMSRLQSKCSVWFEYRKGRLTASNFHEIVRTNCDQLSSTSLLKKIMQYNPATDTSATQWGIKHEEDALKKNKSEMMGQHVHFELQSSGLIIHQDYPFLAASPDAVITCDCCGKGVVEVKCPHSRRENDPCSAADPSFFLEKHSKSDKMCPQSLKPSHKYYTQIQGQMTLTKLDYCDFVCWTTCGLHIERVRADSDFFLKMEQTLRLYFLNIVLPELLTQKLKSEMESHDIQKTYCLCGFGEEHDDMIACDNKGCPTEWYHVECVGLKLAPKGKWVCFKCKNSKTSKRKRNN